MSWKQTLAIVGALVVVGLVIVVTLVAIDTNRRHEDCLHRYDYPQSEIMCN